jgi:hypothetical protein
VSFRLSLTTRQVRSAVLCKHGRSLSHGCLCFAALQRVVRSERQIGSVSCSPGPDAVQEVLVCPNSMTGLLVPRPGVLASAVFNRAVEQHGALCVALSGALSRLWCLQLGLLLLRVRLAVEVPVFAGQGALEKSLEECSFVPRDGSAFCKVRAGELSLKLLPLPLVYETDLVLSYLVRDVVVCV